MKLKAENVRKQFIRKRGGSNIFEAVHETSLEAAEGVLTLLSGPSGSGKSTLLMMAAGLLTPDSGKILAGETDLYALDDGKRSFFRSLHIGLIPQGQTAIGSLTVRENILLPLVLRGKNYREGEEPAEAEKRADALMERVGILDLADVRPSELSGGELKRMAIVRALLPGAEIILADEPTADLDEENTRGILTLLKERAAEGCSVLLISHDTCSNEYADRVYTMKQGIISGPL